MIEGEYEAETRTAQHAEKNVFDEAEMNNLTITEMGASRMICADCEQLITANNIAAKTAFSGKKSKKRKQ